MAFCFRILSATALESRILGTEHDAHAAFAQAFNDPIPAQRLTDHADSVMVWGDPRSRSLFRRIEPGKWAVLVAGGLWRVLKSTGGGRETDISDIHSLPSELLSSYSAISIGRLMDAR